MNFCVSDQSVHRFTYTGAMFATVDLFDSFEFSAASEVNKPQVFSPKSTLRDRKSIFIQDLGDTRVTLCRPLPVQIANWGDQVTVYSADTGDFAIGSDEDSALDEFRASVVELYFLLKEDQSNLGPLPLKHWNFLNSIIDE